ncbi:MAG: UbiD family decarboxylase, partial [Pseudomonadota bacterium]|nr:UbiD family decarboxylase [Pseudomonadota bacterium]
MRGLRRVKRPSQIVRERLSSALDSDDPGAFHSLREFLAALEARGDLKRIAVEVDPHLEITEICHRTLRRNGPALLFENSRQGAMRVIGNLFGSGRRVASAIGLENPRELREIGRQLAF